MSIGGENHRLREVYVTDFHNHGIQRSGRACAIIARGVCFVAFSLEIIAVAVLLFVLLAW